MYFFKGMIAGFLIAVPVGAVGMLCIRRALADGRLAGFVAGLGAAAADTFYGAVAALGLSLVSDFLSAWRLELSLGGGIVLSVLGIKALQTPLYLGAMASDRPGVVRDFTTTLIITLTNPATALAFMGVFAWLGAVHVADRPVDAALLISGIFTGAMLWWSSLSIAAGAVRHRFSARTLRRMHQVSAILLILSGLFVVGSAFFIDV